MKIKEEETIQEAQLLFTFDLTQKELLEQTQFLYGYYVAKLKQLRSAKLYVSSYKASQELFYKDMISACACYLQECSIKSKTDEGNNEEGGDLP